MRVGVTVPQVGALAGREALLLAGRCAEEAGLSSVWVSDHVAFPLDAKTPYPYSRTGEFPVPYNAPFLEALICLGALASTTDRITLGTSVLVLPLRETLLVAKQLATLAAIAPGRLVVGLGAGWLREEFALLQAPFAARGRVLDAQIEALRGLWSEPGYEQTGEGAAFPPVLMEPRPCVLPEIWVGGTSPAALRRAGRLGDAWHAIGASRIENLKAKMSAVTEAALEAGRSERAVSLTARIGAGSGPEGGEILKRRLYALAEVGCDHVVVDPSMTSLRDVRPFYEAIASIASDLS